MTLRTEKDGAPDTNKDGTPEQTSQVHNPSLPKPQPADSQQSSTPVPGEKPANLSPFPTLFDGKTDPEKKKKKHEKAELPYCSKKRYLKYANWHPVTYKNSAIQKQSKSTPAQIASPWQALGISLARFWGIIILVINKKDICL